MARPMLVTLLCGTGTAVLLALGGCGGAVEEAGQADVLAEPAGEGAPPEDTDGGGAADGRPGAPGGEASGGGGARPGVPYDQPLFQDRGRDLDADARQALEDRCAGVCTVAYSYDGDPDDPSSSCRISDFSYEPPAQGDFFQAGAEVTVHVVCAAPETSEGETTDGETTDGETTDEETSEDTAG